MKDPLDLLISALARIESEITLRFEDAAPSLAYDAQDDATPEFRLRVAQLLSDVKFLRADLIGVQRALSAWAALPNLGRKAVGPGSPVAPAPAPILPAASPAQPVAAAPRHGAVEFQRHASAYLIGFSSVRQSLTAEEDVD